MRAVDEYAVHPWGLYVARPTPGRAQFHYLESWLLPSLGLRATVFHFNPGHERDHDYYLDVGEYTPGPEVWRAEDHYLDIEVRSGARAELCDIDELLDAVRHGLLTPRSRSWRCDAPWPPWMGWPATAMTCRGGWPPAAWSSPGAAAERDRTTLAGGW
ncbi:hypothetical protein I550_3081 [Mycobacterium intracellulare 1956]|uniref:DUF402 domain-containing protein n=1 Tax=Mycobacterium intracellulare 1956 TaxID=1299331 RepID=X8CGJ0_MYCIT|nr:hypothetical protein I550_3081 [Mycobacterium intracellulare 1956]